jgi:hypothetical protein
MMPISTHLQRRQAANNHAGSVESGWQLVCMGMQCHFPTMSARPIRHDIHLLSPDFIDNADQPRFVRTACRQRSRCLASSMRNKRLNVLLAQHIDYIARPRHAGCPCSG